MATVTNPLDLDEEMLEAVLNTALPHIPKLGGQMWECLSCGCERQWGDGLPPVSERGNCPALICEPCRRVTRHVFAGLYWGRRG
jgi:hypothetical protein